MVKTNDVFKILLIAMVAALFLYVVISLLTGGDDYKLITRVNDFKSLQEHFVIDNPLGTGADPTGGSVQYDYMMEKDSKGTIKKNVNGDIFWGKIGNNATAKEIAHNYENGVELQTSNELSSTYMYNAGNDVWKQGANVGAPRLASKKLYQGGLFIFDIEAMPTGCGMWPAVWLNGFVGHKNQYREKKGTSLYKDSMKKLVKSTVDKSVNGTCGEINKTIGPEDGGNKDENLSEFVGKPVYVAMWPAQGEFDILEQISFNPYNTISLHTGPRCETVVKVGYDNMKFPWESLGDDLTTWQYLKENKIRSGCGITYGPLGPYSGCRTDMDTIPTEGFNGGTTTLKNGRTRYNCPAYPAGNSGNTQINMPKGTFGPEFNKQKGGVYAFQWIPKKIAKVWYWPRSLFSEKYLKSNHGPLSSTPKPELWADYDYPDSGFASNQRIKTLFAVYQLNNEKTINSGCDFNFQEIILNISVNGSWGQWWESFCGVVNGKRENPVTYLAKCYKASPERASTQQSGTDPVTGCNDGAFQNHKNRGTNDPVFYSKNKMKIRDIKVFQRKNDKNIW